MSRGNPSHLLLKLVQVYKGGHDGLPWLKLGKYLSRRQSGVAWGEGVHQHHLLFAADARNHCEGITARGQPEGNNFAFFKRVGFGSASHGFFLLLSHLQNCSSSSSTMTPLPRQNRQA
jgi:hypothetical protein